MGPEAGAAKLAEQCDTAPVEELELRRDLSEIAATGVAMRLICCFGRTRILALYVLILSRDRAA